MTYLELSQQDVKAPVHLIHNGREEDVVLVLLLGNRTEVSHSVHQRQVLHHHRHHVLLQHVRLQHVSVAQSKDSACFCHTQHRIKTQHVSAIHSTEQRFGMFLPQSKDLACFCHTQHRVKTQYVSAIHSTE